MRCSQLLVALATLGLASAIHVPEDIEDGIWGVDVDDQGNESLSKLADLKEGLKVRAPEGDGSFHQRRVPLPNGEIGCTGNIVNYSDLATAQLQLENYCGASASIAQRQIATYNGALAYVCRYGDTNTCADHEAKAAFASLSGNCGNPSAPEGGWYFLKDWNKTYGYDTAGSSVCSNI